MRNFDINDIDFDNGVVYVDKESYDEITRSNKLKMKREKRKEYISIVSLIVFLHVLSWLIVIL